MGFYGSNDPTVTALKEVLVSAVHCAVTAHNTAQNRPDNFPSYPPDNN